jgi:sodium transport system ATP-binding protein
MKVALARAIVHAPRNLLLDEPTNGLDIPSARGFRTALGRMRDEGICVVLSSHIIQDVVALCDDVVIIARGRTVAQGDPAGVSRKAGCANLEEAFMVFSGRQEAACPAR